MQENGSPQRTNAVVYARVSSKEQEREGFSIPAQLGLLRDFPPWQQSMVVLTTNSRRRIRQHQRADGVRQMLTF